MHTSTQMVAKAQQGHLEAWQETVTPSAGATSQAMDSSQASHSFISGKLEGFIEERRETPYLAVDLDVIAEKYCQLNETFWYSPVYYAVKANPERDVVALLAAKGSGFDVASPTELELCLSLGVHAARISFGNTIKKSRDIAHAYRRGVRRFAFDSEMELRKIAANAPGVDVMCRILTSGENAGWPLSRKFGCDLEMAEELLLLARKLGLQPAGLTFHVGSQQTDPTQWRKPLLDAARLFQRAAREGVILDIVNIGGGFPAQYQSKIPPLSEYAEEIEKALKEAFGSSHPELMLEPGRSLVAEAGVIDSEVVLVSRKSRGEPSRWVYLDVGKFGGLAETLDESIKYWLRTVRQGPTGPIVLAGPTCDSADILYEKTPYALPLELEAGDRIQILNTGAYTSSYSSVGFNGFSPLRTYCI